MFFEYLCVKAIVGNTVNQRAGLQELFCSGRAHVAASGAEKQSCFD